MSSERITYIDSMKFVLIFFVILGHALECNRDNLLNLKAYTFIYSFHMPAFVLLSGYFSRPKWGGQKLVLGLLATYMVFQVLYCGDPLKTISNGGEAFTLNAFLGNIIHFYKPAGPLWYILSLVFWRLLICIIPYRIKNNWWLCLSLVIVVGIVVGFIPIGRELSFQRTFVFFFYFMLGYYFRINNWLNRIRKNKKWIGLTIILLYGIAIGIIPHIPLSMLVQFHHYGELGSMVTVMVMRAFSYVWMLPLAIAVLQIIPDMNMMAKKGKESLFFYVYHVFLIALLQYMVLWHAIPTSLPYIILYSIVITIILGWLLHVKLLRMMCQPVKLK